MPALVPSLGPLNAQIHSIVADLLQVVVSRGEAEASALQAIESALETRLFLCVQRGELDLQNKLLHVLHTVIHAIATSRRHARSASSSADVEKLREIANEAQPPDLTREALFVRVLSDAIFQQNSATLHHWVDFLLMTIPQFRHALHTVILPLVDSFVSRLDDIVTILGQMFEPGSTQPSSRLDSTSTDAEYTVLVNSLERLLLIAVAEGQAITADDEPKSSDKSATEASGSGASGLLGYMSGVLGSSDAETTEMSEETKVGPCLKHWSAFANWILSQTRHAVLRRVRDSVQLFVSSWDVATTMEAAAEDDMMTSQGQYAAKVKVRVRKALERLYKAAPSDVLENVIVFWHKAALKSVSCSAPRRDSLES